MPKEGEVEPEHVFPAPEIGIEQLPVFLAKFCLDACGNGFDYLAKVGYASLRCRASA